MQPSRLSMILDRASRGPLLKPDGTGEGGPTGPTGSQGDTGQTGGTGATGPGEMTAEQRDWYNRTREHILADVRSTVKREQDDERTRAERDAETKRLADKGEYEAAKGRLEQDLQTAQGERDNLKALNQTMADIIKTAVDGHWPSIPETVRKVGELAHGEDDIVGRFRFLTNPSTQELIRQVSGEQAAPVFLGGGADPKANGSKPRLPTQEELNKEYAEMRGGIRR